MKIFKNILATVILSCLVVPVLVLAQGGGSVNVTGQIGVTSGPNAPGTTSGLDADSGSSALDRVKNLVSDNDNPTFDADYTDEDTLTEYIGLIVSVILGLLGVIFTLLIIWAGYNWMTAQGNDEKVSKASKTIWTGIIGLLIVIGAFAIWRFVFERIVAPQ